jgi:ZIP family zinc transporter
MNEIAAILLLTIAAGSCIPLGGYLASFEHVRARWLEQELRHFLIALGGGILIGAVAVVLVPEGIASMHGSMLAIPIVLAAPAVLAKAA